MMHGVHAGMGGEMGGGGMGERPGGFHRPGGVSGTGFLGTVQFVQRAASGEKPQINALAEDPATQEIWAVIGGDLVHFDKDGNVAGSYCLSTADQAPVKPSTILVDADRILIGIDPFGIFEYGRPDK